MKKMWKRKKDKSAVSPVIATILMVAITVVLAAVLYVMVMGFGGTQTSTPSGSFTIAAGTTSGTVTFSQINPVVKYTDCKITVIDNTVGTNGLIVTNAMTAATGATTAPMTAGAVQIAGAGFNPSQNGQISVGDTLKLTNSVGAEFVIGHSYTVSLLYIPSGGIIASANFISN